MEPNVYTLKPSRLRFMLVTAVAGILLFALAFGAYALAADWPNLPQIQAGAIMAQLGMCGLLAAPALLILIVFAGLFNTRRFTIYIGNGKIEGPAGLFSNRRVTLGVAELDRLQSSEPGLFQKLTRWRYLRSTSGNKILFFEAMFSPEQAQNLLEKLSL